MDAAHFSGANSVIRFFPSELRPNSNAIILLCGVASRRRCALFLSKAQGMFLSGSGSAW